MKRLISIFFCLLIASFVSFGSGRIAKSPDYGKYDAEFSKVFNDVSLIGGTDEAHSLVVLKSGKMIFQKHDAAHGLRMPHILWSASKSFTSLALGFAVQDGLLSLDDKVVSFFSEDELPAEITEELASMTVWNLATMSSGFSRDLLGKTRAMAVTESTKETLASPIAFTPGTQFKYNSMNTYLIGAIVARLTGEDLDKYLDRKLFRPLGIKDYYWEKSAEGLCCGGWGLFLSPESLAKAGQFMLQEGAWNGKQLLDKAYIREATSAQVMQTQNATPEQLSSFSDDDWQQGYGYQFWKCTHGAYRMAGAHNQFVIVIPDKDAVIVFTSSSSKGQSVMSSIWNHIYPLL